jgi:hypothetical protein
MKVFLTFVAVFSTTFLALIDDEPKKSEPKEEEKEDYNSVIARYHNEKILEYDKTNKDYLNALTNAFYTNNNSFYVLKTPVHHKIDVKKLKTFEDYRILLDVVYQNASIDEDHTNFAAFKPYLKD